MPVQLRPTCSCSAEPAFVGVVVVQNVVAEVDRKAEWVEVGPIGSPMLFPLQNFLAVFPVFDRTLRMTGVCHSRRRFKIETKLTNSELKINEPSLELQVVSFAYAAPRWLQQVSISLTFEPHFSILKTARSRTRNHRKLNFPFRDPKEPSWHSVARRRHGYSS